MAFKLKVVDNENGIMFDAKRQNLAGKSDKPDVVAYSPNGLEVTRKQLDAENKPVQYTFKYVDSEGNIWAKEELKFKIGEEVVTPIEMTKIFEVKTYRPAGEYLDRFVVEKYYELAPETSMEGKKKSVEIMERLRVSNLIGMRKLWEKLDNEQTVAGGHFNSSTGGFSPGMAFIRAVRENGMKWGLELGVFKEEKIFQFMNEGIPKGNEISNIGSSNKQLKSSLL